MMDLFSEATTLSALLEETRGVVSAVLGTPEGELRTVVGNFANSNLTALNAATLITELAEIGSLLGLGQLTVASLKGPPAARVFAHQSGAVLAIELDPKRPLSELEGKLRTLAWAPGELTAQRAPTVPRQITVDETGMPVAARGSAPAPLPLSLPLPGGDTRPPLLPSLRMQADKPRPPPSVPIPPPLESSGVRHRPDSDPWNERTKPPPPPPSPTATHTRPKAMTPATGGRHASAVSSPVPIIQAKSPGSGPVFTGDLEQLGLPDLLEFLRNSHRTGLLVCETAGGDGSVQLSRGMIVAAESPHALDLREHFLTNPAIELARRHAIAALPAELFDDESIDAALGSRDLVTRDELERARIARIYSAFREMLRWTAGRFSFDPAFAVVVNPALALSAHSILMDIYQEQDEQGR